MLPHSSISAEFKKKIMKMHAPWKTFPSISTSYDSMTSWIAAPTSQSRTSIPAS
jgi:hypothetical protein